jgi:2-polyprenyl-3-methyl-5-hydroxy-6-metoxy-1,4-benzoquinol methylase
MRFLRKHVSAGQKYLEVGCAPGKMLSWVAAVLKADVAGLDFSERGLALTRTLFRALNLQGDLRYEDFFQHTFEPGTFDVVSSFGLIEHFDDPRDIVRRHVLLLKPGGLALIVIPNYMGIYGFLQQHFDRDNLALHNLEIMNRRILESLAPSDLVKSAKAYPEGRMSPWLVSFDSRWPRIIARSVSYAVNVLGLLQPFKIIRLCPFLVLEMVRN